MARISKSQRGIRKPVSKQAFSKKSKSSGSSSISSSKSSMRDKALIALAAGGGTIAGHGVVYGGKLAYNKISENIQRREDLKNLKESMGKENFITFQKMLKDAEGDTLEDKFESINNYSDFKKQWPQCNRSFALNDRTNKLPSEMASQGEFEEGWNNLKSIYLPDDES